MAAIDKLYISNYSDLSELRVWANIYFPKLFTWFYDKALTIDAEEFNSFKKKQAKKNMEDAIKYWKQISPDDTLNGAIAYLISQGYSEEDANEDAKMYYHWGHTKIDEFEHLVSMPVMNTPFWVDKKLKWICPLRRIREYLKDQCGVKDRWYHKLFWKGRDYFE